MRALEFTPGHYYHIYNAGNLNEEIFRNENDYARFLYSILFFQSPVSMTNIPQAIEHFLKHRSFNISESHSHEVTDARIVELVNFALLPNHFHLTLCERRGGGISDYLHKTLLAYTKYFNIKYKRNGHLFRGTFKAAAVKNNSELLHLSAYIHRCHRTLPEWRPRAHLYPWSSVVDYVGENRWGEFLKPEIILKQFVSKEEYKNFVGESSPKDFEETVGAGHNFHRS